MALLALMYVLRFVLPFDQTTCSNQEKQLACKFRLCFEIAKDFQSLESAVFLNTLRPTER